ncbi:hypothetical protein WN943_026214 [Citrus x changshan-huyou]
MNSVENLTWTDTMAGHLVRINSILTRKGREQGEGKLALLEVSDGSCPDHLAGCCGCYSIADLSQMVPAVTSVYVEGLLENPPKVSKQKIELQVEKPRKNTIAAVARIRSALAYATRTFFYLHEFLYMDTPVFTTIDCEGAAEMFRGCTRFLC